MPLPTAPVKGPLQIIFMGTPFFAVPTLEGLLQSEEKVILVITQPDKPKGRSKKLFPPPVMDGEQRAGVEVWQPQSVRPEGFLSEVRRLEPDLAVVAAYGKIIPQALLDIPRYGCVNVHASLLPKYRGAAPIQWAIIQGERVTGITTILMDAGMDTGDVLHTKALEIRKEETAGELQDRLAEAGREALLETVALFKRGILVPQAQDHSKATLAPPLKKEDGRIDWGRPSQELFNRVRGVNPWPGAYTYLGEKVLKIFQCTPLAGGASEGPGVIAQSGHGTFKVATGEGYLILEEIQLQGGRRMRAADFLHGHSVEPGERFS